MPADVAFEAFVGKEFDLYGADCCCFKLAEPGEAPRVYEAIEDEEDGYRSSLKHVVERLSADGLVFSSVPIVRARCRIGVSDPEDYSRRDFDGLEWVDDDGHVWLYLGTSDSGDYYPNFSFGWLAKEVPPEQTDQ